MYLHQTKQVSRQSVLEIYRKVIPQGRQSQFTNRPEKHTSLLLYLIIDIQKTRNLTQLKASTSWCLTFFLPWIKAQKPKSFLPKADNSNEKSSLKQGRKARKTTLSISLLCWWLSQTSPLVHLKGRNVVERPRGMLQRFCWDSPPQSVTITSCPVSKHPSAQMSIYHQIWTHRIEKFPLVLRASYFYCKIFKYLFVHSIMRVWMSEDSLWQLFFLCTMWGAGTELTWPDLA